MQGALTILRRSWVSLSLSIFCCFSITLPIVVTWFDLLGRINSAKDLALAVFGIFLWLICGIWLILSSLLCWLHSKQIHSSRRDTILLLIALVAVVTAVYFGWTSYGRKNFPNRDFSNFEVQISRAEGSNTSGSICILEISDRKGKKIQPEHEQEAGFSFTGDWAVRKEGCQYFLQGNAMGSLRFYYAGRAGENIQFLFRDHQEGGNVLIHFNGEQITEVNLESELEGNKSVFVRLRFNRVQTLIWDVLRTFRWCALLVLFIMGVTLGLRNVHPSPQILALARLPENHPWVILIPLIFVAILMFWPPGVSISPDVGYYLSLAKNLYYGNGYVNPDLSPNIFRGPVFPLLISFSYMLFGESFRSAIILERIFWFLTILIAYALGRQLYNPRVGFLAASFILAAGVINQAFIRIWTDGPLTFAILALQLMFWQAFISQRDAKWYVLMGAFMGITYLLKQTVIFIAPLPLLTWLVFSEYRTRQTFKRLLVFYLAFAVFYFGWEGYVYLAGGSSGQITGTLQTGITFLSYISRGSSVVDTAQSSSLPRGAQSSILSLLEILHTFYTRDILQFYRIAILFPVSLVFLLYQAIVRKTKPDIFLALGLLLYSPLILVQVVVNFSFRQNLYFYCVVLLCIATMLDRLFGGLPFKKFSNAVVVTVAISLICIQLSGGNYSFPKTVSLKTPERLPYLSTYREAAAWVDENVKPDMKIMIPSREGNFFHVLTAGNRQFEVLNTCMGEVSFSVAEKCIPPYISFWVYKGTTDPNEPRDFFQGISEPVFLSTIRDKSVEYIFVTPTIYSLYRYLVVHPDFEEVDIIDNIAIFRVTGPVHSIADYQNIEWEPCIGRGTSTYLKNLKDTDANRFEMRLQKQLEPWMGLDREDLDAFMNWQGCQFEVNFPGSYRVD
jgi:4-amino-4-deoxy-L-arabinose transferase-like glycosyltransferase